MKSIGSFLRTARESAGITQAQIARYTKDTWGKSTEDTISANYLSEVEANKKNISINKLNLVTEALIHFGAR